MIKSLPRMVLSLVMMLGLLSSAEAVRYQATLLDSFVSGGYGCAYGINNYGKIVGESRLEDGWVHACLWDTDGSITDLGTYNGGSSTARDINNAGQIVGSSVSSDWQSEAVLWQNGTPTGIFSGEACAINDNGQIAGNTGAGGAFMWGNGKYYFLGQGTAKAINSSGNTIVGISADRLPSTWSYDSNRDMWRNFSMNVPEPGYGGGYGIEGNEVVGFSGLHATIWDNPIFGNRHDLGTLGGEVSLAYAINSNGQVVGYSYAPDGFSHAFIWQNGEMLALDEFLRATGSVAYAINDLGEIAGGMYIDGIEYAVIWTPEADPVPEPSSAYLMIIGMAATGLLGRRRLQKDKCVS